MSQAIAFNPLVLTTTYADTRFGTTLPKFAILAAEANTPAQITVDYTNIFSLKFSWDPSYPFLPKPPKLRILRNPSTYNSNIWQVFYYLILGLIFLGLGTVAAFCIFLVPNHHLLLLLGAIASCYVGYLLLIVPKADPITYSCFVRPHKLPSTSGFKHLYVIYDLEGLWGLDHAPINAPAQLIGEQEDGSLLLLPNPSELLQAPIIEKPFTCDVKLS